MANIYLINGANPSEYSKGTLNAAMIAQAQTLAEQAGHAVRVCTVAEGYDVAQSLQDHLWADLLLLQFPVHWMGVPWNLKKFMDEVYTAGLGGQLCQGDGRSTARPKQGYGTGGVLQNKRYLLSVTFNAPAEAFNDESQWFFAGGSVDDLLWPQHLNFKFFGMQALPTFAAYDVIKNPQTAEDLQRFAAHFRQVLQGLIPA